MLKLWEQSDGYSTLYPGPLLATVTATATAANSSSISDRDRPESWSPGEPFWRYGSWEAIAIAVTLLFVTVGTVIGNILVCVAVCLVRKLRRPCNYLLVSLAVSDLCVAVLVMPMALIYEIFSSWPFGPILCDLWVSFDVLSCTASILNLCMISVDRYSAITKPLEYGVKRTPQRMLWCVGCVWLSAACISVPPLLILGNEHGDGNQCVVCQNFWYQIYATLGSFYIPLIIMACVYIQIFKAARRIVQEEKKAQSHLIERSVSSAHKASVTRNQLANKLALWTTGNVTHRPAIRVARLKTKEASPPLPPTEGPKCSPRQVQGIKGDRNSLQDGDKARHSNSSVQVEKGPSPPSVSPTKLSATSQEGETLDLYAAEPSSPEYEKPSTVPRDANANGAVALLGAALGSTLVSLSTANPRSSAVSTTSSCNLMKRSRGLTSTGPTGGPSKSRLRFQLAKERKASTTLGIIMSAFTLCWLPFFVLALVRPFIDNPQDIPHSLSSVFLWLGYANSLLNPIIYATLNKDFRKPFREILCLRCSSLNTMMREEFYHTQYGDPGEHEIMIGASRNGRGGSEEVRLCVDNDDSRRPSANSSPAHRRESYL